MYGGCWSWACLQGAYDGHVGGVVPVGDSAEGLAGLVQPDPGGDGPDPDDGGGLPDAHAVDRDQLQHGTFTGGEPANPAVEGARPALGVDALLQARDVVIVKQAVADHAPSESVPSVRTSATEAHTRGPPTISA